MWSFDYSILYLLYLVFTVLFQYSMSMALFQSNVLCTEPNEVTPCGTQYLEHKENGHCYKCTNGESHQRRNTFFIF